MSGDHPDDLSSLVDEKPSDIRTVEETRTPIGSVEEGDVAGETARPVLYGGRRRVGIRTRVHDKMTSYEQLREAQCAKYPCAACANAQFFRPESEHGIKVKAFLEGTVQRKLRIWHSFGPSDFIYCEEDPIRPKPDRDGNPTVDPSNGQVMTIGGPGYKYLRYNCPAWRERTAEFLPDWLPPAVQRYVERAVHLSNILRRRGVGALLRKIRGECPS